MSLDKSEEKVNPVTPAFYAANRLFFPITTMIALYQDYVHNNGVLRRALARYFGAEHIIDADANDIIGGILTSEVRAFFMPGGASRYVADKLNGAGNATIRTYVEQGGTYVGICAGAYYACRRTEWLAGHANAISVDNELDFFAGVARGPIPEFMHEFSHIDNHAAITMLHTQTNETIKTLYNSGPLFVADDNASCVVVARYADLPNQPAAIITGTVGQGRYMLCSPHLEFDDQSLHLLQFDVPDNRMAELAALPSHPGLDGTYFAKLLTHLIA